MSLNRIIISYLAVTIALVGTLGLLGTTPSAFARDGYIVSMGDSFSSGEGIEPYIDQGLGNVERFGSDDFLAHRSERSWPGKMIIPEWSSSGLEESRGDRWHFVASSGATIPNILGPQGQTVDYSIPRFLSARMGPIGSRGSRDLPPQIDILKDLRGNVEFVTLTIGGNDIGFGQVMTAGTFDIPRFSTFEQELGRANQRFEALVQNGNFQHVYQRIYEEAGPGTRIIVAGYPTLVCERARSRGTELLFTSANARALNSEIRRVNKEIEEIVDSQNIGRAEKTFFFACVLEEFRGNEAFSSNPYIFGLVIPARRHDLRRQLHSNASFHPNEQGAEAYARVVSAKIAEAEADRDADVSLLTDFRNNTTMVFDISGSMNEWARDADQTKMDSAKSAGRIIVSLARNHDEVGLGVVSFNDLAHENQSITSDYDLVTVAIEGLRADFTTNIKAGLEVGIDQLMTAEGNRMMIFLSDGMDTVGNSFDEIVAVANEARNQGIIIHTIGFGHDHELDEPLLREIAEITGGTYVREDASSLVGLAGAYMRAQIGSTSTILNSSQGQINQGETVEVGQLEVETYGSLTASLFWPGSSLDIVLTDPSGITVGEDYPGISIVNEDTLSQVTIEDAMQGTWEMEVYGANVSVEQTPFYIVGALTERPDLGEADSVTAADEDTSIPETLAPATVVAENDAGLVLLFIAALTIASCGLFLIKRNRREVVTDRNTRDLESRRMK